MCVIPHYLILSWLSLVSIKSTTSSSDQEVLTQCCETGQNISEAGLLNCSDWQVPVPNVPEKYQNICVATMEVCCWSKTRDSACQRGQDLAKEGQSCQLDQEAAPVFDQTLTECCIACNIGAMTPANECSRLVNLMPSPYAQSSFVKCCFGSDLAIITDEIDDGRCPDGFVFNEALEVCDDIDECLSTMSPHLCDPNFEVCVNTIGDYLCDPIIQLNDSSTSSTPCPEGYKFFLINCIDVDECEENLHNCSREQVCVNTEGSFNCDRWDPSGQALICPRGYRIDPETEICVDVNECLLTDHNCNEASQRCINTLGSYNCVRHLPCGTGYTFNSHTGKCEDNNECALGLDNCASLGPTYLCRNTQGSFRCDRKKCNRGELLNEETGHCQPIICQAGFQAGPRGQCVDVDECAEGIGNNPCLIDQRCINTLGSYNCVRKCTDGLRLSDDGNDKCVDVDECSESSDVCPSGHQCTNFIGGYRCDCPQGFELNAESQQCQDIDECSNPYSVCGLDSVCQNSPGSFRCTCKAGFRRNSNDKCVDLNECTTIPGICQQRCKNLFGHFRCHCRPGYRLSTDGRTCSDINECQEYQNICIGNCQNEPGSYRCTCPQGYTLSANERSCEDIDECSQSSPCRGSHQTCFNTRGGFKCIDTSCPEDYDPEGSTGSKRCKLKAESRNCPDPRDRECLRRPVSLSFNFISLVSELRIGISDTIGIDLFTMQSARIYSLTTKFNLQVTSVRAAKDVREEVTRNFFHLKTPQPHRAVVSLVKSIQGPQDVILELRMDMYHLGRFQASAVANVYVFVTPYKF